MKKKILHITPHISGGVGSVLLSTLKFYKKNKFFNHEIIAFEKLLDSEKVFFKGYLKKILRTQNYEIIKKKICASDIVQIEWWSHPLIYEFLINFNFPKCRIIICSHIAGFFRPNLVTLNIVKFSDIFLATSKATKKLPIFSKRYDFKKKLRFINFPINFERFKNIKKSNHKTFNVGYVGTLDYSKLHKNFLLMSSKIRIPKIKFVICGKDLDNRVYKESLKYKNTNFDFRGFTNNLSNIFSQLDIFGYPLNPKHFGTGEQVLKEAMFAKLPIVVFNNPCERNIIINNRNGVIVKTEKEYISTIEKLYQNNKKKSKLGFNANQTIIREFNARKCFDSLDRTYNAILNIKKHEKNFIFSNKKFNINIKENIGAKIFIESLDNKSSEFVTSYSVSNKKLLKKADIRISKCENEMKVKNKGSLFQYLRYFPKDDFLNYWAGIVKLKEGNLKEAKKLFKFSKISKKRLLYNLKL